VNLATGRPATVRTFAETAAGILGIPPENLEFGVIPTSAHEMEYEGIAVDLVQQLTGWIPPTSIAEGVRRTVETSVLRKDKS
jgi:nucleoside-diphosphate-sugar epimerase